MKTNHDGTIILNAYDTWTACNTCGQKVTGDSIHTCSPQLKTLTDEEIEEVFRTVEQDFALTESKKSDGGWRNFPVELGRAILRKAQEK